MPSFKNSLIVEQFQENYFKNILLDRLGSFLGAKSIMDKLTTISFTCLTELIIIILAIALSPYYLTLQNITEI